LDEVRSCELTRPVFCFRARSENGGHHARVYSSNTGWKPPQNIRPPSKGISICAAWGSALILSLAASRVALSGYSIQLKTTVFVVLCLRRPEEVGHLAPRHVVSPTFGHARGAQVLEVLGGLLGVLDVTSRLAVGTAATNPSM
jgi:hypothetical protein